MKTKRTLLCLILALVMVMGFAPVSVMAEEPEETENGSGAAEEEILVEVKDGILQNGGLFLPKTRKSRGADASYEEKLAEVVSLLYNAARTWDGTAESIRVDVSGVSFPIANVRDALISFMNGNPDMFYIRNGWSYSYGSGDTLGSIVLYFDKSFSLSDINAFYGKTAEILAAVDGSWSDEQKALYIHDYLVTHCEYDLTYSNYDAYHSIVAGSSVCQGYALAYTYLMNQCGVECQVITSDDMNHAWNMIEVGGEQYYVDCTWDDPVASDTTTLYQDYCGHDNLLRSTEGLASTGHSSIDWVDAAGNYVYNEVVTGTAYEDAWWLNAANSAIPNIGNAWAYINMSDSSVYTHDYASGADTKLYTITEWCYYPHLIAGNESFYLSTYSSLYLLTPNGGSEKIYSLTEEELTQGNIYGIHIEGNKLYYRLYVNEDAGTFVGEYYVKLNNNPVLIMQQPQNQQVVRDENAMFSVIAEGHIASYQWQYKIKGKTKWYNCSSSTEGYNTAELHVQATFSRDGFQYRCKITNIDGDEFLSDAALLTVIEHPITITSQPQNQVVAIGDMAHFTVVAEGNNLTYQWQYKIAGKTKWYNSSATTLGYNTPELEIKGLLARSGYQYRCEITDENGYILISDTVLLTVTEKPPFGILAQPQSQMVEEGGVAYFVVVAGGEGLKYRWQYKIAGKTKWYNSSSSTIGYNTAELQVIATIARDGYQYRCIVSDSNGNSETSSVVTLTIASFGPKITSDPQNQTVAAGDTAYFTIAAKGEGLSYQWQYKIAGQSTWRNCTSSTTGYQSEELEVVGTAKRNGYQYRCKVTDANGETVTSKAATLTVE